MDAAASILNIIQITGTLVDYLRAATQAPSDRRKLLLEANSLYALLISLKDFINLDDEDVQPGWRREVARLAGPDGPLEQYSNDLASLLTKSDPKGRLRRAGQTVLWKMAKDDVKELLTRIERMKSLVNIALEMDQIRLTEVIHRRIENVEVTTELIRQDTITLVNSADEAAFRELLDQICLDDYASVYRSNITEHTTDVGQNFLASPQFEAWVDPDNDDRHLLCLGDPGVGKTVMATKAIQALRQRTTALREAVIFVYCDCTRRRSRLNRRDSSPEARSKGVQTPGHFIASLLRQLVEAHGKSLPRLQDLMATHDRQKTKPKTEELEQAFVEVAQNFDRVYIVVDAMDEVDSLEMETFASLLLSISSVSTLQLLVTTRRHPQIEQIFEESARLEMQAHDDDTLRYLQSRAQREFPPRVRRDAKAVHRILSALLSSANGIPLIARLHMNALRGLRTPGAMLDAIARLKSNSDVYDETYQAAMERIRKQPGELPSMAMKVLRWIVCAKRYLYTRELQCVLAMRDDSDTFDEDFMPDMDDVFLACEGLVCTVTTPNTETVRLELVHTTARQYFDRNLAEWAPDVNLDLTRTCLNVLAFEDLTPLPRSMVAYAWRYWGQHAKDVEELNEEQQFGRLVAIVRKFLVKSGSGSALSREVRIREEREYPMQALQEGLTGYHLAAKFGLTRLFEALWDPSDNLDMMPRTQLYNLTPLLQAVMYESVEIIKSMLRARCSDANQRNSTGWLPLEMALAKPDIVKILLEDGSADASEVDCAGLPLVLQAAVRGHEQTLELLLSAGTMDPAIVREYGPVLREVVSLSEKDRQRMKSWSLPQTKEYVQTRPVNKRSG